MELQWPLIVFTTLVAWSAGLFGTQALMAAFGVGKKAQVPAWIASAVLLAVGGIAVFFHLEHWERIFNGFGHLTSGITQELIAIVVLAAVAVAYLVMLRKSDDGASVPKWLAWLSVALSVALVAVMAHSYTMAARPAWDSVLWILYVLGNACVLGPATFAFLMAAAPPAGQPAGRAADAGAPAGLAALVGAAANALAALAFAIFLQLSAGSFADVGYYFDPTHPTEAMADAAATVGAQAPLLWLGAVAVGAIVPLAAAFMGRRSGNWRLWAPVAIIAALAGAVCMRVAFYNLGLSVFMFYEEGSAAPPVRAAHPASRDSPVNAVRIRENTVFFTEIPPTLCCLRQYTPCSALPQAPLGVKNFSSSPTRAAGALGFPTKPPPGSLGPGGGFFTYRFPLPRRQSRSPRHNLRRRPGAGW